MKTVTLNKKQYSIPENWDELTGRQLLQVMNVLFFKGYDGAQQLLQLVKVLTGMSNYQFFRCSVEEMDEIFYLVTFVFDPEKFAFTKNVMPYYDDGRFFDPDRTAFYGPSDELTNLRMKEFTDCEHYYMKWWDSEKKDEEALDLLCAILYRPGPICYNHDRNELGDHREPYSQELAHYYVKHYVRLWPPSVKRAIATWYDGCRRAIIASNPDVFEGGEGDPALYGLVSVMLSVAESHVFGDFTRVEDQYVSVVMMQLNEVVVKARKLEPQSKSTT